METNKSEREVCLAHKLSRKLEKCDNTDIAYYAVKNHVRLPICNTCADVIEEKDISWASKETDEADLS